MAELKFNPEHRLVPYEAGELPAGPWLVFAPHADDETFGMGGSLLRASQDGLTTHVVVLTDGALGGQGDDLVAVRQREVTRATERLGVTGLTLWDEPDRGLRVSETLVGKIREHIRALAPASVFFPAAMELHPDHRATAELVWQALAGLGTAPAAFGYEISVQSPVNLLLDISPQMAAKQTTMAVYASQNNQVDYPGLVTSLNRARALTLAGADYAEGFFHFRTQDLAGTLQAATTAYLARYFPA